MFIVPTNAREMVKEIIDNPPYSQTPEGPASERSETWSQRICSPVGADGGVAGVLEM